MSTNFKPDYFFCQIEKNTEVNFLPKKAEPNATGYDVKAAESVIVQPGELVKIRLGFKVLCPEGWWLQLNPRSSTFMKKELVCLVGIIDQDFNHEVCLVGKYLPKYYFQAEPLKIEFGERIGQVVPVKIQEMGINEIDESEYNAKFALRNAERNGGFGSSGTF
ncbi:MAG: hypothetical protein LC122_13545 [Chitinophagales bacterium]|nr:hypothetical protein [Chitinophagales bacterium]